MIQAALRRGLALFILFFCASIGAAPSPVEAGGVRFDDAIRLGGSALLLNGAGVRNKAVFKVYAAGLYLGARATTAEAGDSFAIDWISGAGTALTIKGAAQGAPIREPAFFDALLRIWIGPVPADWQLKDALLGK